jgi:uncharacterized cupredoxin-like copper-binding protein
MTATGIVARVSLLVAACALLVTLACGGDDDNNNNGSTATETPEATERSATPRATEDEDGESATPTVPPADTGARIALNEWAIQPERTRARPGTVTFEVRNEGEFRHEFVIIRTDIEKDELPRKPDNAGVDESDLDVVGRIPGIEPGASDTLEVDVEEGQYVIICNLAPEGQSHYLNGMFNEIEITATAPLDSPTPAATQ